MGDADILKNAVKKNAGRLFSSLFPLLSGFGGTRIILMYHQMYAEGDCILSDPALVVKDKTLDMHIRELSRYFDIVPLDELMMGSPGSNRFAITFDDGWRDNYDLAYPVLKSHKAPATIFISPNLVDNIRSYWFHDLLFLSSTMQQQGIANDYMDYFSQFVSDWEPEMLDTETTCDLISRLKVIPGNELEAIVDGAFEQFSVARHQKRSTLTWQEIDEMGKNGITFGPHGLNHFILTNVNSEIKRREVFESLQILKDKKVALSPFFSFPNGDWDPESLSLVREAGYSGAVTTKLGKNSASTDPFLLRRISLHEDISSTPSLLWFRIFQALNQG